MINHKEVSVFKREKQPEAITCDRCGKTISYDEDKQSLNDTWELQEFYTIRFTGGYGSIFGDGNRIECDLCQNCLMALIKPFYRVLENEFFPEFIEPAEPSFKEYKVEGLHYNVVLEPTADPKFWGAYAVELAGCTATGNSEENALAEIIKAIDEHVELLEDLDKPVPPQAELPMVRVIKG